MSSGKNSGTIWSVSATDELGVCCGGWATTRRDSRGFPEDPWQEVCPLGLERVTQGWMRTSSVVSLVVGSLRSKQRMRHLARELILSGNVNWPRRILANRPVCSWPWNGYLETIVISIRCQLFVYIMACAQKSAVPRAFKGQLFVLVTLRRALKSLLFRGRSKNVKMKARFARFARTYLPTSIV